MKKSTPDRIINQISSMLFLGSAGFLFSIQHFWMGTLHLLYAFINLAIPLLSKKYPEIGYLFLGIFNALLSFVTIWIYVGYSNPFIKIVWLVCGFLFLIISMKNLNKAFKKYL